MAKKFTVYILRTSENTLYTGQTNDLANRLLKHQAGKGAKYMRRFKTFKLVHTEEFDSRTAAMKRESEIKKLTKKQKESLFL